LDEGARYERFHFLKNNFEKISSDLKSKVLVSIRTLEDEYSKDSEEKKIFTAWKQMRWAQALKTTTFQEALKLYQELYALTGNKESEHPEFSTYMSSGWVGPISPWSIEDFGKANPSEI